MGNQLSTDQLERLQRLLYEERDRQLDLIDHLNEAGLNQSMTESVGELSSHDQHTADAGSEMQAREMDFGFRASAEETVARIDDALDRMAKGSYGTCIECGLAIPAQRLDVLPYAERCTQCAEAADLRAEGSREEGQRSLSLERSVSKDPYGGYDGEDTWRELARWGTANSPQDDLEFDDR